MRGIILGVDLHDYSSELCEGDLVVNDDVFYKLESINKRFNRLEHEKDTDICYFVESKINGELMNFERKELSKASILVFDSDKYFKTNTKIKLGNISVEDLRNIKSKILLDLDLPLSDLSKINLSDIICLEFDGHIIEENVADKNGVNSVVKYFKLN